MAAECLVNARRCGRLHCFITGPFFLLLAGVSLLYGLGVLPLGPHGWQWLVNTLLIGGCVLTCVPEWLFGRYFPPGPGRGASPPQDTQRAAMVTLQGAEYAPAKAGLDEEAGDGPGALGVIAGDRGPPILLRVKTASSHFTSGRGSGTKLLRFGISTLGNVFASITSSLGTMPFSESR